MTREGERIENGAEERWEQITATGARLLLTRGTPRPGGQEKVAACLAREKTALECGANAAQISAENPLDSVDLPAGATHMDLTDAICPEEIRSEAGVCPAIVGNVAVWYDNSHLSGTYVETMVPYFEERLQDTVPWLFED
ncbi:hypothetical protein [Micrococcoides hystricis]|uniref:SGNH domain-containing protein n=1 Tax=Micrococcoides hystricis TaxID=1572761 RepID=A0ABV6PC79_9MICC